MWRMSIALCVILANHCAAAEDCPPTSSTVRIETDDYSFAAESAAGAVGDVVGITVSLRSRVVSPGPLSMALAVCHDARTAEILGTPMYTDEFLSLLGPGGVHFLPVNQDTGSARKHQGYGFLLGASLSEKAYNDRFPSVTPLAMMVVYYRIQGRVGDSGTISFCDFVLARDPILCAENLLHVHTPGFSPGHDYLSIADLGGTVTVLEGLATHPDRPPDPPEATIYPERPSNDVVNFRVKITGASARPGSREVPVEVYATAGVEYSGIMIPIDFDERYLRLARAEDHFLAGLALVDNENQRSGADLDEGNVVVFSGAGISYRRLAPGGEEIHAATLYFDVLDTAAEITSTTLSVRPVRNSTTGFTYSPWIKVRHLEGGSPGESAVQSEVTPISIANGVFLTQPATLVRRGDSNFDGELDISDPVSLLSFLFLGGPAPVCSNAAEFNRDGHLDISDPIAILRTLFFGAPMPGGEEPREVPCN